MHKNYQSSQPSPQDLKTMSDQDFLELGQDKIAYARAVTVDGEKVFALHGADGVTLDIAQTQEGVAALAIAHEMYISTLH